MSSINYQLTKKDKTYIDLSLAFEPSALNNDITTLQNERAINNAIKNIVMTVPLEVPFNRNFGSRVSDYLFDVVDERAINFCEPRVTIEDIRVGMRDEQNAIEVTIKYKIVGSEKIYTTRNILTPTR